MENPARGRGRGGRPPLRGRRGRGRPPLGPRRGRGGGRRGRGRMGNGMLRQQIQITIHQGDDIVSSIDRFALHHGYSSMYVYQATGIVSEVRVNGRGFIDAGNYEIETLQGMWSEFEFRGDQFLLNIHLRDLNSSQNIHGNSRFLLASNNVTVYGEVIAD